MGGRIFSSEGLLKSIIINNPRREESPHTVYLYSTRVPLWSAVCKEHEGAAKLQLGRDDVYFNESDVGGQTPLLCAAYHGLKEVVKILFRRDCVNPNKLARHYQIALHFGKGHAGVIALHTLVR